MAMLKEREGALAELQEQCKALETHVHEVESAKKAVEQLEWEEADASKACEVVTQKIEAERQQKSQLDQRSADVVATTQSPEVLQRKLNVIKKRNEALQQLHDACSDPTTSIKEEEALARQQQELVRLTKDRQLHQRELKQRVRQIEATTAKVDQERMLSSGDASKQYEAYITRLKEMERRGKEACDQRREVAENMEKEWGRWLELLIACARSLQAKADSGVEAAALGDTETPAASVLDVVHRSEVRKARLKVELRAAEATERGLQSRLDKIQAKIEVHQAHAAKEKEKADAKRAAAVAGGKKLPGGGGAQDPAGPPAAAAPAMGAPEWASAAAGD